MVKRKISGIYSIVNIKTGDRYIGSSKDIDRRWYVHKDTARKGKHHSRYFQRAWNKYGEDSFKFFVIEEMEPIKEKLEYNEQNTIWLFRPVYNSGDKVRPHNVSESGTASLSEHMKKINKKRVGILRSKEALKRMVITRMGLTETEVYEIVELYKSGWLQCNLAKKFKVKNNVIWRIVNNKISIYPNIVDKSEIIQIKRNKPIK